MQNFTMKALYIYSYFFLCINKVILEPKKWKFKTQPKTHRSWETKDPSPHTTLTNMTHSSSKVIKTKPRNDKASHTDAQLIFWNLENL